MWATKVVVASCRYPYRTPSLIGGPHEILYDRSVEADSQVLNAFILLFQDQHYDLKSVAKVWRDSFILPQNTPEWQQKIKSTLNITISTATFAKQKPSSSSKPPPREVFLRSHRQTACATKSGLPTHMTIPDLISSMLHASPQSRQGSVLQGEYGLANRNMC